MIADLDGLYITYLQELGFEIIEPLYPSSTYVYKVKQGADFRTAKLSLRAESMLSEQIYQSLVRENLVLQKAKNIKGVVRQISFHKANFDGFDLAALVREYVEGRILEVDGDQRLDQEQCDRLKMIVAQLHALGIACLDIKGSNIIINRQGEPCLIDPGTARFLGEKNFQAYVTEDLDNLDFYCRRYNPNFNK